MKKTKSLKAKRRAHLEQTLAQLTPGRVLIVNICAIDSYPKESSAQEYLSSLVPLSKRGGQGLGARVGGRLALNLV